MRVQLLGILDTDDWEARGEKVREGVSMKGRVGCLVSVLIVLQGLIHCFQWSMVKHWNSGK